jgi:GH24 family phage-related lysozyme (muramidase)
MNRPQTAASLVLWKTRELKAYREWQRLKRKNASLHPDGKRMLAFKSYNHAHQMRVRRGIELRKLAITHITEASAEKIVGREGLIRWAYLDSRGLPTAWIGHLIQLKRRALTAADFEQWGSPQHPAARERVVKFFRFVDLLPYEKVVLDANKKRMKAGHPSLADEEIGALVSFTFNIGSGGFVNSTVRKRVVAGADKRAVGEAMMMWVTPPEIRERRESERDQYLAA